MNKKHRDNKYQKILSAAAELISEKGFGETSLQQIADKVGIHKTTLFHYVKSKDELLLLVLEKTDDDFKSRMLQPESLRNLEPEEQLRLAMRCHLDLLWRNSHILMVSPEQLKMLRRVRITQYIEKRKVYEKSFRAIIRQLKKKGYFDKLEIKIVALGILGMLNGVKRWYRPNERFTLDDIADMFHSLILGKRDLRNDTPKDLLKKVESERLRIASK